MPEPQRYQDVIIVGSGPAGYTAAIYTARANLKPLVVEGWAWGGLLQQTTDVENFPGFPEGVMGPELMERMRAQAERFGAQLETDEVTELELSSDGGLHRVHVDDVVYTTRTVILAMGSQHRKLGVPGEEELAGRGVSYCATCDAAFFRDVPTVIVGGGDSAMEEAIFLAKFARKVAIIHRRDEFRASPIMLDRARATENIEILTSYTIDGLVAGENGSLASIDLTHATDGSKRSLEIAGAFVAIGHVPQSELVAGQVELDENGYVRTVAETTATNLPGVFAAGDLVDHSYRQAITAAGSGCRAAIDAERYLRDNPVPESSSGSDSDGKLASV